MSFNFKTCIVLTLKVEMFLVSNKDLRLLVGNCFHTQVILKVESRESSQVKALFWDVN